MLGKGDVGVDSVKTPEQPKRKKFRPKVVKEEAKPKQTQTRRKIKRPKKDQESTTPVEPAAVAKKICARALDFDFDFVDESFKPENGENQSNRSALRGKQSHSAEPTRKRGQSKRKNNNGDNQEGVDPAKRRKRRQGTDFDYLFPGQQHYAQENVSVSAFFRSESYSFTAQSSATMKEKCKATFQGGQSFGSNVCLDRIDTSIKKRTTSHARYLNWSSVYKAVEVSEQLQAGCYSRAHDTNNLLLVETLVTLNKTKRIIDSEKSQSHQKTLLPNTCQFHASFTDINREYSETALVPYSMKNAGAIVPLIPVMENMNSDGIDGSEEHKAEWWEEEPNVFLPGRAESFLAKMHLVLGDRRFTPWKGSVVDSVVGAFLTQNVSDNLSSSAFMSLASKYPAPSVPTGNFDVGTRSMPSIQITYLDSEESVSNPPSSVTLNNTQPDEEKGYVNRDETSRSSSEAASSAHGSVGKTTDSEEKKDSNAEVDKADQTYLVQNPFPSEDSALICQNSSLVSDAPRNTDRAGSSSETNSKGEKYACFVKLLQDLASARLRGQRRVSTADIVSLEESNEKNQYGNSKKEVGDSCNLGSLQVSPNTSPGDCSSEVKGFKSLTGHTKSSDYSNEPCCYYQQDGGVLSCQKPESSSSVPWTKHKEKLVTETSIADINESTRKHQDSLLNPMEDATLIAKGKKEKQEEFDWDSLRREAQGREGKREKTSQTMDTVDWEAIRTADISEVAETIKSRGMQHKLAERIQGFLNRLVTEHDTIDLEWLRDVPPDKAKEYLLSFKGLGLKSVECVRLLTLHHLAFPVDTNVARVAVRLGWVPLQPLPESLQLHLLEMYPLLKSIHKYLWPRLCKFDHKTLYKLHYQMITFGKVFCTKSKPNCNACPMRGECRHFASAFASARRCLPGTEKGTGTPGKNPLPLRLPESLQREQRPEVVIHSEPANRVTCCDPIIEEPPEPEYNQVLVADIEDLFYEDDPEEEEPALPKSERTQVSVADIDDLFDEDDPEEEEPALPKSECTQVSVADIAELFYEDDPEEEEPALPKSECTQVSIADIEDAFYEDDPEEIYTIRLNSEEFTMNLKKIMEHRNMSTALVALDASLPMPKLKNISKLRTEHRVYELPDSHPLLAEWQMEKREQDDPCSYLLAIWTPGETADSVRPAVSRCIYQGIGKLCEDETCFSCNSVKEARSQTVRGTILIPCRTAVRGSFPLNGTYFQVNEVFADHASSLSPIDVPREWLWNLPRRTVYFGTSVTSIFKGLSTEIIQQCFWRGCVCVRGFDPKSRVPRPLIARLHFPASNET